MEIKEIFPYTILALGPFCPVPERGFSLNIITLSSSDLPEAMAALSPRLWIPVPSNICPAGGLTLQPTRSKDFTPDGIIQTTAYLRDLVAAGEYIAKGYARGASPADLAVQIKSLWPDLPLDLSLPTVAPPEVRHENAIDDLLAMVAVPGDSSAPAGGSGGPGGPREWQRRIAGLLTGNMEAIFSNREFRACEAAWRGLECLLRQGGVGDGKTIVVKIVPVSPETLPAALDILTVELAGDVPDLILIDTPLDNTPGSIETLGKAAACGAALLTTTATWITPVFFHLDNWGDLHRLDYLKHHLDNPVYAKWRSLREQTEGHWLAVTCNRFLTRTAYGEGNRPRSVSYTEGEPLWISPVWALGALAAQSVQRFGWPSRLTDYMAMRLTDLALPIPAREEAASATEAIFSDDRIRQFVEIGMTPLAGVPGQDIAFMPKAAAASGESLLAQMFFARIIAFLLRLREKADGEEAATDPADFVAASLTAFFSTTGQRAPDDLTVVSRRREDVLLPLDISFTPPAAISPYSQKLAFTFSW